MSGIEQLRQRVIAQVEETVELDNGYRFVFPSDPGIKSDLVEFMEYEAKCCTFLDFVLEEEPPRLVCTVIVKQYDVTTAKEIISTLFSD